MSRNKPTPEPNKGRIEIILGLLALMGTLAGAIFPSWDKIFPSATQSSPAPSSTSPSPSELPPSEPPKPTASPKPVSSVSPRSTPSPSGPSTPQEFPCKYPPMGGGSVSINLAKRVFSPLEPIKASFSTDGIPSQYQRWIGVVEATASENISFDAKGGWNVALDGAPVSLPAQKVGEYQVRLVIKTESGTKVLAGYCPITVK